MRWPSHQLSQQSFADSGSKAEEKGTNKVSSKLCWAMVHVFINMWRFIEKATDLGKLEGSSPRAIRTGLQEVFAASNGRPDLATVLPSGLSVSVARHTYTFLYL